MSVNDAFHYKSFAQIEAEFSVCLEQLGDDIEKQEEIVEKCLKDTFYGPIEYGFELVFGANTSPGFVCGVKEAVIEHSEKLPGFCCLVRVNVAFVPGATALATNRLTFFALLVQIQFQDTPYELSGDGWGHEVCSPRKHRLYFFWNHVISPFFLCF